MVIEDRQLNSYPTPPCASPFSCDELESLVLPSQDSKTLVSRGKNCDLSSQRVELWISGSPRELNSLVILCMRPAL